MPIEPQTDALRGGVEILVATPGRLLDLVGQRTVNLGQVEILVLDEADRMLDMGFLPDIRRILALLPARRQTLLFSATFCDEIRRLSESLLRDPATVEVAPRNTAAESVRQVLYPVDRDRKHQLLDHLIRQHDLRQVLVFTRTKIAARRLATWLDRHGIAADAIHCDRTQPERTRALADFKRGEVSCLVATDVASRGLDIEELPHVVNFELPTWPRTTSTASGGPAEPAPRVTPSRWSAPTRSTCCGPSSACSSAPSPRRSRTASSPIATPTRDPSTPAATRAAPARPAAAARRSAPDQGRAVVREAAVAELVSAQLRPPALCARAPS